MGSCDGMRKTAEALTVLEGKLEAAAVLEDRSSQSCQTFLTRDSGAFQSRCYKACFDGSSVISSKNCDREQ